MANSNRIFVSPGVYTSEKDITFVAQSVGVTTLGLVGETLKGPAFEPILISNFDEFKTYFGGTSPEKDGGGNPKYELPYFAKSYLQESNQLFVTRVLGLTGYKPNKTFGIKTIGGVNVDTTTTPSSTTTNLIPSSQYIDEASFYGGLSGKTSTDGVTSVTDYIVQNYSGLTVDNVGDYFTIGLVPESSLSGLTGTTLTAPITLNNNQDWYNVYYHLTGSTMDTVNAVYSYLFVWADSYFDVTRFVYNASLNEDYHNITVAALRSRGRYINSNTTLSLEVTDNGYFTINNITDNDITSNPFDEFNINVTGSTSGHKQFTCSFDSSSTKYISKVLGTEVFDKPYSDYPLYVHEVYPNLITNAYNQGKIIGISLDEVYEYDGSNFAQTWDTPASPMVVSEVRGGNVSDLFQVITISDGEDANFQVKISIVNIDLDSGEFDVMVRDFNDTDDNMVILEKFTRCSMSPDSNSYVGRKIGTSDGEYELRSKYIMLSLSSTHPTDAIPAGFRGYITNSSFSGTTLGGVFYKTQYYDAGDVIGYESDGTEIISSGDKVKKVNLGLSSQIGFDADILKYKGLSSNGVTEGFHLSTNASTITGNTTTGFAFATTEYDLEGVAKGKLDSIAYRKFTFAIGGGNDGWDIYRNVRTYDDSFIFGKIKYTSGSTTNGGVFNTTTGNSDYYAYLKGIETFSNPEAVNINIFATPGINFEDHTSLVNQAIDMIENERADSLYIINSPNITGTTSASIVTDVLDTASIDSNYSATYWPWIQVRDTDNATQLFIPPTGEVLKNIALTDNVAYPWFASAGYTRGLVNSIKASKKLTADERDVLYKNRINPIATFADTGTIIWGNKTLQVKESALDRINVRRLLLRARKLISAVAVRLLFEQNDEQVRQEFLRLVNPILESIKKERGLSEFKVTVSNDPEDIDANTLRGKIYIKPNRSLEFIDVEFQISPTGATFENI
jgi:hypothetical protein